MVTAAGLTKRVEVSAHKTDSGQSTGKTTHRKCSVAKANSILRKGKKEGTLEEYELKIRGRGA